ncbi:hypothetical protein MASR1M32_37590 [Rhodobacter sp.]
MTESAHQNIDPAAAPQVQRASELHFLHIGKTAGNQIGQLAAQLNKDGQGPKIVRHGHLVQLYELDPATPYFFRSAIRSHAFVRPSIPAAARAAPWQLRMVR